MGIQGVDVYHGTGRVDWQALYKAGTRFAYIKASEGGSNAAHVTYYHENYKAARAAGLIVGAYHFMRANVDSSAQVAAFCASVGIPALDDLPPALDIETTDNTNAQLLALRANKILQAFEARLRVRPTVYTYASFANDFLNDAVCKYPLWLANYGEDKPTAPAVPTFAHSVPRFWHKETIWQYSQHGRVHGISSGDADLNYYPGTVDDLRAFIVASRLASRG